MSPKQSSPKQPTPKQSIPRQSTPKQSDSRQSTPKRSASQQAVVVMSTREAKHNEFLAACFMNQRVKPQVDDIAVASSLNMSVGGVRNKLRPVIKAMEEAKAPWTLTQPPKRPGALGYKPPQVVASQVSNVDALKGVGAGAEQNGAKANGTAANKKLSIPAPVNKRTLATKEDEEDVNATEETHPRKRTKASVEVIIGQNEHVEDAIKQQDEAAEAVGDNADDDSDFYRENSEDDDGDGEE